MDFATRFYANSFAASAFAISCVRNRARCRADGSVQEFIERGLYHDRFGLRPVVDASGILVGMLEGDDVRDVPIEQRVVTPLREVARPVDLMRVVAPDDLLSVVVDKAADTDRRIFFVVEHGRVLGTVDAVDVVNTLRARKR